MKIFEHFKKKDFCIERLLYAVIFFIGLILFYTYIYGDITTTARMGISFWDNLFAGRIRYYYQDSIYMTTKAYAQNVWATYDFPIYIIFAIWNYPIWLVEHFFHIDVMNNILCLMWIKSILFPFIISFLFVLRDVCIIGGLDKKKADCVCLLFLSSGFFVSSIIIISQYDIISMCFIMLGIRAYLCGNKKKFKFWFGVAIPIKLFAFLIFVPLLMLREKRIKHIILDVLSSLLLLIFFRLLIPTASNNLDENGLMIIRFPFEYVAHLGLDEIYLFPFCLGILILCCYFVSVEKEYFFDTVMMVCFLTYFIQFTTMNAFPYWLIMMAPYVCIIVIKNDKLIKVNGILELLMTSGLVLAQMFRFYWCFDSNTADSMLLRIIAPQKLDYTSLSFVSLLARLTDNNSDKIVQHLIGLGSTVFVACGLIFAVINLPFIYGKVSFIDVEQKWQKKFFAVRLFIALCIGFVPAFLYLVC